MWLAPDPRHVNVTKQLADLKSQYEQLLSRLGGDRPDFVLFPEAWLDAGLEFGLDLGRLADLREAIVDWIQHFPNTDEQRCLVGVSVPVSVNVPQSPRAQVLVDTTSGTAPYVKHSTAGWVAFSSPAWSEDAQLPVWPGAIGPTICHDMYLSLLARSLVRRGATVLVNPSATSVNRLKWERMLRARAVENHAFMACTVAEDAKATNNVARAWVYGPSGGLVPLWSVDSYDGLVGRPRGREPSRLYVADLDLGALRPEPVRPTIARSSPVGITIKGDRMIIGGRGVSWGEDRTIHGFRIVSLPVASMAEPAAWVIPLAESDSGRCLYWLRTDGDMERARVIAEARAIELASPTLIEPAHGKPLLVELATNYKAVHSVSPPAVDARWQRGVTSAFSMMQGLSERPETWRHNLARYLSLARK